MRKFIKWLISLFKKKSNSQFVNVSTRPHFIFRPQVIKVTAGGNHVLVKYSHGVVRKPKGCL